MTRLFSALLLAGAILAVVTVHADEPEGKDKPLPKSLAEQALEQEHLAGQFQEFEKALLRLKQRLERSPKAEDRERAVLLQEAIKKAGEAGVDMRFKTLIGLLQSSKSVNLTEVKDAMDKSKLLADDIRAILALLMSDNRDAQLKNERERIKQLLAHLDRVLRETKVMRAQTEAGRAEKEALVKGQEKVAKDTADLAKAMGKGQESKEGKAGEKSKGGDKNGEKSKGGDKDGKSKEGKSQDKQGKEGSKSSPNGQQQQSGEQQQQSGKETPGQKQVEEAHRHQRGAEENLRKEKRDDASKEQDKAIQKLEEARRRLEEILRQLREEEQQRLLAALQARCEQMLVLQLQVYDGTVRVDRAVAQNADKRPSRAEEQRALQLSDREQDIVRLANKAIELLEAEGSAVAFPEVFTQIRDDMQHVARRLGKADVGTVTQGIEQDIINTLKEMIDALKKAQQNRQQQSGQPNAGQQQPDRSLIDLLAELKMIRSLQVRINARTLTYGRQYQGEQANDPDIQHELADLAQRQLKLFEVTNNIARGKNR
jgi:hypothetical protein